MTSVPYHTPLLTDDLRRLGIPDPWSFGIADRTRFSELDMLAHINNAAYLSWFESFRVQYLNAYGLAQYRIPGPAPVLRKVAVDFLAEMKIDEDYVVTGRSTSMRKTSLEMEYAVWSSGTLRTTGYALLVFLSPDGSGYTLSDAQRETLRTRDGTIDAR